MSDPSDQRPLYARVLRLRHLRPGGLLCFAFFEGAAALAVLLALAELTSWWAVPVLPAAVAVMVKINDVVAGATRTTARESAQIAQSAQNISRRRSGSGRREMARPDLSAAIGRE